MSSVKKYYISIGSPDSMQSSVLANISDLFKITDSYQFDTTVYSFL